jgi:predicted nucleic acid-binding protein
LETHWRNLTQGQSFSTKVWNDAYLAAFALAAGLKMITFDQAFAKYPNIKSTILS